MDRTQKDALIRRLHDELGQTGIIIVTHYKGLTVAEMTTLRGQMRQAGARFSVTKNRLVRRALDGTRYRGLADLFVGPTAVAVGENPVAAAKVAVDFAKSNAKLVLLGGAVGDAALDIDGLKALAALPSLDELRGRLIGLLNAPAGRLVGVLQAPAGQLARVLAARAEQQEEAAA